jgi:Major intrinsic protein
MCWNVLLTLAVNVSLAHEFPVPTAIVAALTLGVCVYVFGDVSGTHINPAITIGILSVGKISALEAINYLLAQCVGAGLAVFMSLAVITPAPIVAASTAQVFIGEILGAFCLAMGVASVVFGKTPAPRCRPDGRRLPVIRNLNCEQCFQWSPQSGCCHGNWLSVCCLPRGSDHWDGDCLSALPVSDSRERDAQGLS